jgi:hypothetical protein
MALHPLRTFQKNRKFWMAAILLVCMITFVLCTGLQGGDFADWLMRFFRSSGPEAVQIANRKVTVRELEDLKRRRETANDYMTRAAQMIVAQLRSRIEGAGREPNEEKRRLEIQQAQLIQTQLLDKLSRPRYFRGGTGLEGLLDFLVWREQADRLNIRLTDDAVVDLVAWELRSGGQAGQYTGWGAEMSREIQRRMFKSYREILEALSEEFRVLLAQLVLEESTARVTNVAHFLQSQGRQVEPDLRTRNPTAPAQFYDLYKQKRSPAEIAVLAVPVEDFLGKDPTPEQRQQFYDRYKLKKYDPTKEEPGFLLPERVEIQWVSADPKSAAFTAPARAVTALLQRPAFLYDPMQPLALAAISYAAHQPAWDKRMQDKYAEDLQKPKVRQDHRIPGWLDSLWLPLLYREGLKKAEREDVAAVKPGSLTLRQDMAAAKAALVGSGAAGPQFGVTALAGYQFRVSYRQAKELAPVLRAERQKRAPVYATLVLSGTMSPFTLLGMADIASQIPQSMPLAGPVGKEYREKFEERQARDWAQTIMQDVRAKLEGPAVAGHKGAFEDALTNLQQKYGRLLTIDGTGQPRSPFDIGTDPGMVPLRKSYEKWYDRINLAEGRGGTPGALKADDFPRLFFSLEKFGVGNAQDYQAKPWPPVIQTKPHRLDIFLKGEEAAQSRTIDFFEQADRAFMFWKHGSRGKRADANEPQGLANPEIRRVVDHAWKVEKAREGMEGRLRELITRDLLPAAKKSGGELRAAFRKLTQASDKDKAPVILRGVAPWTEKTVRNEVQGYDITFYEPYEVPHGTFLYPREDTTKQILALRDMAKPLESGDPKIDHLNQELFKQTQETGRVVQVLTNSPKTVFYVVALVLPPQENPYRFFDAYRKAVGPTAGRLPPDFLIEQAYQEFAGDYRQALMVQLRALTKLGQPTKEASTQFPDAK